MRKAPDYREFLRAYLEAKSLSFSDLARAAGFARGFPSDVISGRRRLTEKSCHSFEKAMKLPVSGRRLFRSLVALAEPDLFPGLDRKGVQRTVEELRGKSWQRTRRDLPQKGEEETAQLLLRDSHALAVYAAAGKPGRGATRAEIMSRTLLSEKETDVALAKLVAGKLIQTKDDRLEPLDLHLFMKAVGSAQAFVRQYQDACQAAALRAEKVMPSNEEFFFTSTFCIDADRLPALKAALRSTVLNFVDDSIAPEGNRIVRLLTGLHFPV